MNKASQNAARTKLKQLGEDQARSFSKGAQAKSVKQPSTLLNQLICKGTK